MGSSRTHGCTEGSLTNNEGRECPSLPLKLHIIKAWRAKMILKICILLAGITAAAIGCYGAYEQADHISGGYLVVAAPVVAGASALIPYFAERAWQAGHRFKGVVFALVLIPAAATVFFAAAERVHSARAGAEAERAALRQAIGRASQAHQEARQKADKAEQDAKTWRAKSEKACPSICQAKWEGEAKAARGREAEALKAVTVAQGQATEESPIQAPIWLLPMALDLFAFVTLWFGLSLPGRAKPVPAPIQAPVVPVAKRKPRRKPRAAKPVLGRGLAEIQAEYAAAGLQPRRKLSVIEGGKS